MRAKKAVKHRALRLLVVDDEAAIRLALERYLSNRGFHVDTAGDVSTALALLHENTYAVAILDIRLSGTADREGLDLLSKVREESPETQAVMLTAFESIEDDAAARRLGARHVLRKPVPLLQLTEVIETLAASH